MKIKISIVKMSALFADPAKAEECFHKLDKVKDKGIFDALEKLLTEVAGGNAQVIRVGFSLKQIETSNRLFVLLSVFRPSGHAL